MSTNGITCPLCGSRTRVLKTRRQPGVIRRRRVCVACGRRLTSYERCHGLFLSPGATCVPQLVKNIEQRGFAGCTTAKSRKNPNSEDTTP